jgi:hypothetical protein
MAALVRWMGLAALVLLPGGLVMLCLFVLARSCWSSWQLERMRGNQASLRNAVSSVKLRDIVREARASASL